MKDALTECDVINLAAAIAEFNEDDENAAKFRAGLHPLNATPKQTRTNRTVALAIVAAVTLAVVVALIVALTARPAHGQIIVITPMPRSTATLQPRAWLMAQKHYTPARASSCEAPAVCPQQ